MKLPSVEIKCGRCWFWVRIGDKPTFHLRAHPKTQKKKEKPTTPLFDSKTEGEA